MKKTAIALAIFTSCLLSAGAIAQQSRNDEAGANWIQKTDMAIPGDKKTVSQIRAEANEFLCFNKWDTGLSKFVPIAGGVRRDMSKLSREQQNMEISMFAKTHMYDIFSGAWVDKATGTKMVMPKGK